MGRTPLDLAYAEEVKEALRKHGGKHSLFYAVGKNMPELVAKLIEEGADAPLTNKVRARTYVHAHTVCVYAAWKCIFHVHDLFPMYMYGYEDMNMHTEDVDAHTCCAHIFQVHIL